MSQEELLRKVRCYFSDEEWAEMPEITKERYANIKRNYDAMIGLGLKPAMPEFMKTKPVPTETSGETARWANRHSKQVAKGKENCGGAKHAPREKTWVAPVRNHAVLTENKEFANGSTTNSQIADASNPDGSHRPRRAQKRINYAECDNSEEESTDQAVLFPWVTPQRANKTVPDGLCVCRSTIKGSPVRRVHPEATVQEALLRAVRGVRVGSSGANGYTWQIRHGGNVYLVDGRPLDRSNWMRYVNCAPQQSQQNLVAFVRQGAIYYRTNRVVNAGEELFVWHCVIRHERIHTGERPFECHVCSKGFTRQGHLNSHLVVHTAERRYECPECGQRFTRSSNMVKHQRALHARSGNSARPYVCAQCGKGFTQSGNLTTHLLIHTGAKPHTCSVCGRRFTLHSNAKKHEMAMHGHQYPVHCPHCNKGCWNMSELRKHVLVRHCDDNKENSEA
ncbi:hypothetical protein MTO96_019334 [Rhipicephalus appendiculatus]